MKIRCKNCVWFERDPFAGPDEEQIGQCRRRAPQPTIRLHEYSYWPLVNEMDYCGDAVPLV